MGVLDRALQYQSMRKSPLEVLKEQRRQAAADQMQKEQFSLEQKLRQRQISESDQDIITKQQQNKLMQGRQSILKSVINPQTGKLDYKRGAAMAYASGDMEFAKNLLEGYKTQEQVPVLQNQATGLGLENQAAQRTLDAGGPEVDVGLKRAQTGLVEEQQGLTSQQASGQAATNLNIPEMDRAKINSLNAGAAADVAKARTAGKTERKYTAPTEEELAVVSGVVNSRYADEFNPALPHVRISDLFTEGYGDEGESQLSAFTNDVAIRANEIRYEENISFTDAYQKALYEMSSKVDKGASGYYDYRNFKKDAPVRTIKLTNEDMVE